MTVKGLAEALGLEILVEGDQERPVTGGYCGDPAELGDGPGVGR